MRLHMKSGILKLNAFKSWITCWIIYSFRQLGTLKGTARSMLVPIEDSASVKDILLKLDGLDGNVSTSETLIQSFYCGFQKDTESIVAFGSRIKQTLSRAVRYGHIDLDPIVSTRH